MSTVGTIEVVRFGGASPPDPVQSFPLRLRRVILDPRVRRLQLGVRRRTARSARIDGPRILTVVDEESVPARKPPGVSWERWIERQIGEAIERGDFDGLPGAGRPIRDLDARRDETAWIRDKLRRERAAPPPPPAIQIRIEVDAALASLGSLATEEDVRSLVEHLNDRIRTVNRTTVVGPPTSLGPLAMADVVARWHRVRSGADTS